MNAKKCHINFIRMTYGGCAHLQLQQNQHLFFVVEFLIDNRQQNTQNMKFMQKNPY